MPSAGDFKHVQESAQIQSHAMVALIARVLNTKVSKIFLFYYFFLDLDSQVF